MTMTIDSNSILSENYALHSEPSASAGTTTKAAKGTDSAGAILPAPSPMASDIGAEIAMLGIKAGRDEQQINQTTEQTQNQVQDDAENAEVGAMRQQAQDAEITGFVSGAMQIGQGGAQLGGSQGGAALWGAGASLAQGIGQSNQLLDQAQATAYKAVADSAGQTASTARQAETDAQSVIQNAIQFYQQYAQTKAQTDLVAAGQKA